MYFQGIVVGLCGTLLFFFVASFKHTSKETIVLHSIQGYTEALFSVSINYYCACHVVDVRVFAHVTCLQIDSRSVYEHQLL